MALHAATATSSPTPWWAYPALAAVVVIWLALYALGCWIWPFGSCQRCSGSGKRRSPGGRAFRLCRRCRGTGRRLRIGRWIYNAARSRQRDTN
jgi:hypothetical protein